jgi:4-hydroxyphenylpyruvate dioxygenase
MCSSIRTDGGVTSDLQTVAKDLAERGEMAKDYSERDGGRMLKVGYEGLSWAVRNTSWEVVRAANRPNVGLIVDSFNLLAVEFATPYNPAGHGRIYSTIEESLGILSSSLAAFVATVSGDKIFFVQLGDAELVDPSLFYHRLIQPSHVCCRGREVIVYFPGKDPEVDICLWSWWPLPSLPRDIKGPCH